MSGANPHAGAQPCVWMSAGLLKYRLCERNYDCENCPLDAALSGHAMRPPSQVTIVSPSELAHSFPDDRLYTPGHAWLQSISTADGMLFRFGIDAFAATIFGNCRGVSCYAADDHPTPNQVLCELDLGLGVVFVTVPVPATIVAKNERLAHDPGQLISACYGDGWVGELKMVDLTPVHKLLTAQQACERHALRSATISAAGCPATAGRHRSHRPVPGRRRGTGRPAASAGRLLLHASHPRNDPIIARRR